MNPNDLILISVDDHLVEPPTMFEAHVPARFRDLAPRVVRKPDGSISKSSQSSCGGPPSDRGWMRSR